MPKPNNQANGVMLRYCASFGMTHPLTRQPIQVYPAILTVRLCAPLFADPDKPRQRRANDVSGILMRVYNASARLGAYHSSFWTQESTRDEEVPLTLVLRQSPAALESWHPRFENFDLTGA